MALQEKLCKDLLTVCHHPGTSCEHKHCGSGDIVFLIRHVTSHENMFIGLCEFMNLWVESPYGESPPSYVW